MLWRGDRNRRKWNTKCTTIVKNLISLNSNNCKQAKLKNRLDKPFHLPEDHIFWTYLQTLLSAPPLLLGNHKLAPPSWAPSLGWNPWHSPSNHSRLTAREPLLSKQWCWRLMPPTPFISSPCPLLTLSRSGPQTHTVYKTYPCNLPEYHMPPACLLENASSLHPLCIEPRLTLPTSLQYLVKPLTTPLQVWILDSHCQLYWLLLPKEKSRVHSLDFWRLVLRP